MVSVHETHYALTALPVAMAQHGITVTYTPKTGAVSTPTAIWTEESDGLEPNEFGEAVAAMGTLVISNDASFGVASPGKGDMVKNDGVVWQVVDFVAKPASFELKLKRQEFTDRWGGGDGG